jgi:hypothetical protein
MYANLTDRQPPIHTIDAAEAFPLRLAVRSDFVVHRINSSHFPSSKDQLLDCDVISICPACPFVAERPPV